MNERTRMHGHSAETYRPGRVALVVAMLFFVPLGLAFYLYYGGAWRPGGRVNAGDLIEPPRPVPALALPLMGSGATDPKFLTGKWTLLYVQRGRCDDECLRHLYDTRQVRLALDREMNRVQRVFIADADCCDLAKLQAAHPDLIAVRASAADEPLRSLLPSRPGAVNSHRIYLVDPLGNLMMSYAADSRPKGMLEDLKRLLRLSSVG